MTTQAKLPKFNKPPVVETVLGVQFAQLKAFAIPHFGLFWSTVRGTYPRQEIKAPLGQVVEKFGVPPTPNEINISLTTAPEIRCWFIDESGGQLIQLQRDRFIRNWRRVAPNRDPYPSYDHLRPLFDRDWRSFLDFLEREEIGTPQVNQCEVTYINHIDTGAMALGDAHQVVRALSVLSGGILPAPESVQLATSYMMGDKKGRLHINLQPVVRLDDRRPVIQLSLTARGTPDSSRTEDILAWLDLGHEWVVSGFADFTKTALHDLWERTQ